MFLTHKQLHYTQKTKRVDQVIDISNGDDFDLYKWISSRYEQTKRLQILHLWYMETLTKYMHIV